MPSFDVVSKVNTQEILNAVNNANKEISTRYDFKNTHTSIDWNEPTSMLTIRANAEGRAIAAMDVLQSKLIKRSVALESLKPDEIREASGGTVKQEIVVQQGIATDTAKKMVKDIKAMKLKVQGQIQGDQVRFSGKKRDTLQEVIAALKEADYGLPLQFVNFRD
jgi:uncharacterized protein YajQ (UPF0234 family)